MTAPGTDVVVHLTGDHPGGTREKATETVRSALRHAHGPIPPCSDPDPTRSPPMRSR